MSNVIIKIPTLNDLFPNLTDDQLQQLQQSAHSDLSQVHGHHDANAFDAHSSINGFEQPHHDWQASFDHSHFNNPDTHLNAFEDQSAWNMPDAIQQPMFDPMHMQTPDAFEQSPSYQFQADNLTDWQNNHAMPAWQAEQTGHAAPPHDFASPSSFDASSMFSQSHVQHFQAESHHITIDSHHDVYDNGEYLGSVSNNNFYDKHSHYAGYVGTAGNIYDAYATKVGWVDAAGHVCNMAGVEVYNSNGSIVHGAAYLLLRYRGGTN